MKTELFKTDYQKERKAHENGLYNEYLEFMKLEGQSKLMVIHHLMKKYNIHSQTTVYNIIKRVENRLKAQQA